MNSLKEAFSRENLLKNLNFFGELNLGLINLNTQQIGEIPKRGIGVLFQKGSPK